MRKLAVFCLCSVLLGGCGGRGDESQSTPPKTSISPMKVAVGGDRSSTALGPTIPEKDMPNHQVKSAEAAIEVDLLEGSIHMRPTLPKGDQQLQVVNSGKETHGLVVEGPGAQVKLPNELMRGDTATMTLHLPAGSYTAWCPVQDHRAKGETTSFTVQ